MTPRLWLRFNTSCVCSFSFLKRQFFINSAWSINYFIFWVLSFLSLFLKHLLSFNLQAYCFTLSMLLSDTTNPNLSILFFRKYYFVYAQLKRNLFVYNLIDHFFLLYQLKYMLHRLIINVLILLLSKSIYFSSTVLLWSLCFYEIDQFLRVKSSAIFDAVI